jgi:hypothetical protein
MARLRCGIGFFELGVLLWSIGRNGFYFLVSRLQEGNKGGKYTHVYIELHLQVTRTTRPTTNPQVFARAGTRANPTRVTPYFKHGTSDLAESICVCPMCVLHLSVTGYGVKQTGVPASLALERRSEPAVSY